MNNEKGCCDMKSADKSSGCCPGCGCSKENCCCKGGSCSSSGSSFKYYYKSFVKVLRTLAIFNGLGLFISLYWFTQVHEKAAAASTLAADHKCMAFCFSVGLGLAFAVLLVDLFAMLRCFSKSHCKKSSCNATSCMGCYFMLEYLLALGSAGFFGHALYVMIKMIMAM